MKVLLSAIGSRGDVQPLIALAVQLRELGHSATLCVAVNFKSWVELFGIDCIPIGVDIQKASSWMSPEKQKMPSKAQLRALAAQSVREYFRATRRAARGFDLILVWGPLQVAGRSVAEALRIPYVHTAFSPPMLWTTDHPPPRLRPRVRTQSLPRLANSILRRLDQHSWNDRFRVAINEQRAKMGLQPIGDVQRYVSTDSPWLAADPVLSPAPRVNDLQVIQTGYWFLADPAPLPEDLLRFLAVGEPPIYFGFGSMLGSADKSSALVDAARALGRRAIISQGWANLTLVDGAADCISIGEANFQLLFPRVAAVVHHGGGGTTVLAASAGKPQVVVPHLYDQGYWAHRVKRLGIGESMPRGQLTLGGMVKALRRCLEPEVAARAAELAPRIELHGARIAAERLVRDFA